MTIKKEVTISSYIETITRGDGRIIRKPMEIHELSVVIDDTPIKLGSWLKETGVGPMQRSSYIIGNIGQYKAMEKLADDLVESSKKAIVGHNVILIHYNKVQLFSTVEQLTDSLEKREKQPDLPIGFYIDEANFIYPIFNASFFGDVLREHLAGSINES